MNFSSIINPIGAVGHYILDGGLKTDFGNFKNWLKDTWNDYTGNSAIEKQNQANLEMARYQQQMQEEMYNKYSSPAALMRQYREAGLNPNLVYGSASSGQSNVPGFNAPHVERNMSGSDKLNKMLSVVSAVQGLMQGIYQTAAAREAAEQSALITYDTRTRALRNRLDFDLERNILGYTPSLTGGGMSFTDAGSSFGQYIRAARESRINQFAESALSNYTNYGLFEDGYGNVTRNPVPGYFLIRQQGAQLDYELKRELRNMGVYGKLAIAALQLFK